MRTLWAGILESQVLCHSHDGHDTIEDLRAGHTYEFGDNLVIRGLTRNGVLHGFGMVIVQSSDPDATFNHDKHRHYFWLVEGWMMGRGIGPRTSILMFDDYLDPVPDAPETWRRSQPAV